MNNDLFSIKEMSIEYHEPPKRIEYLIAKHRIRHIRRIGLTRMFDAPAQAQILEALRGIQIRGDK